MWATNADGSSSVSGLNGPVTSFYNVSANIASSANSSGDEFEIEDECLYSPQPYLAAKFYLITVFGSCVSVVAFCNNCLLIYVLARSPLIKTHVFYLCVLAVCDVLAEISYILLLSAQILFEYAESITLYRVWHNYARWLFALTNVALTVSAYMLVTASAERFLSTLDRLKHRTCTRRHRWLVVFGVFCFALISKGTVFWEVAIVYKENCSGFGEYNIVPSNLAQDFTYKVGYMLWFRHIAHVFFPFFLLIFLNCSILLHLKRNPMEMHSALVSLTLGDLSRQRKKSIRAATLMLAAMVTTYLISNLVNVIITVWEHVDKDNLQNALDGRFYTFAADTVSLLTVVTGCIRLPIYCACNKRLRKEVFRLLSKCRRGGPAITDSCKRLFVQASNDCDVIDLCQGDPRHEEQKIANGGSGEQQALITSNEGHSKITITTASVVV